jgi:hypothetical protein
MLLYSSDNQWPAGTLVTGEILAGASHGISEVRAGDVADAIEVALTNNTGWRRRPPSGAL